MNPKLRINLKFEKLRKLQFNMERDTYHNVVTTTTTTNGSKAGNSSRLK